MTFFGNRQIAIFYCATLYFSLVPLVDFHLNGHVYIRFSTTILKLIPLKRSVIGFDTTLLVQYHVTPSLLS